MKALPKIGDVVCGKYRILRELGRGGMGVVYEAINVATEGQVALKVIRDMGQSAPGEALERMAREARAAAKLRSKFVGRVFDFERGVLVMELMTGHDLAAEIRRTAKFPLEHALAIALQACAGVGEAHALDIVHRDLKPANLFLDRGHGGDPMVKVLDFGLSKRLSTDAANALTSPDEMMGTLGFMSPEQMRASRDVDARTDVWALGLILFRMVTGRFPFAGTGADVAAVILAPEPMPRAEGAGIPAGLTMVMNHCPAIEWGRLGPTL